ncbi:hypothetical protein [Bacillus sp. RAR_GA_16]|uniref:hypothetical protein n=1 Tax=Bacillus sp. RAR_GA_16 TaxID=2876774 RepID=UPI001CCB585F|nr:hypothetical protein [Bacillus sp. RAR_GA_16]MCA0171912.1 hypothetical protein [Bacillus sp. RAR_GA_16]
MENDTKETNPLEASANELPKTKALQDDFTRDFITSTKQTENGSYTFVSATKDYRMNFPTNATIGKQGYSHPDDSFEQFTFGFEQDNYAVGVTIEYQNFLSVKIMEESLDLLKTRIEEEVTLEERLEESKASYYAPFGSEEEDEGYVAFLQNKKGSGGIFVFVQFQCLDECVSHKEMEKWFLGWLDSVTFTSGKEGEDK